MARTPKRLPIIKDSIAEVPLTRGQVAIIDASDADLVGQYNWHCGGYIGHRLSAVSTYKDENGANRYLHMHRLILDAKKGQSVDHINHNALDNRRSNLRLCSHRQNSCNQRPIVGHSSYKGVTYLAPANSPHPWKAMISYDGKTHKLGKFRTEIEAALAYDLKALELHGEFAYTNFTSDIHAKAQQTPPEQWANMMLTSFPEVFAQARTIRPPSSQGYPSGFELSIIKQPGFVLSEDTLWSIPHAAKELGATEVRLRQVVNVEGIPGVTKLAGKWLGPPEAWRAWDAGRQRRGRRHKEE